MIGFFYNKMGLPLLERAYWIITHGKELVISIPCVLNGINSLGETLQNSGTKTCSQISIDIDILVFALVMLTPIAHTVLYNLNIRN